VAAFRIYETLVREELAYQIPPRTYNDDYAFAHGRIAFKLGSSSAKPYIDQLMEGKRESWGIASLPQKDPRWPKTVLYGPNIVIFNTTPEHQRAAWQFARFFAAPETVARWASNTGYVPFRKSAARKTAMKAYWEQGPYNRVPFDCLEFARPEPNVAGWQEVRVLVERALTAVLTRTQTAREAATELKKEADKALERARRPAPASP
jgi:ABC-type glycerol-3-phosphate transport system substrate-binding protein